MAIQHDKLCDPVAADVARWSASFSLAGEEMAFARLLDQLVVRPINIYTAKLRATRNFCRALSGKDIRLLNGDRRQIGMADYLDVLALLITASRLARTGELRLKAPAFWVANPGSRYDPRLPVLPMAQLCELSGRSERELRIIATHLVEDGALRAVTRAGGPVGFVAMPGFAEDGFSRSLMRL